MATFIVQETERGLLREDGRLTRWLEPGRHRVWSWGKKLDVKMLELGDGFSALTPELARVVPAGAGEELTVREAALAIVSIDGRPTACLQTGRWILWHVRADVRACVFSLAEVLTDMPAALWPLVPRTLLEPVQVAPYERVLLYVDGRLERVLGEGSYGLVLHGRAVRHVRVDLREREVQVVGQEVMTADKVTIRVNLLAKLRVADPVLSVQAVTDLVASVYAEAQMVARRFVAGLTVDQLVEQRHGMGEAMRSVLAARAEAWGAEVFSFDLKDVVLPGEMRVLMNRVIEAEKQAMASLILRREETAATRSLANTARLLETSPTLLRLKELEAYKEMAGKVGQLTIVAAPNDLMHALRLPAGAAAPQDGK